MENSATGSIDIGVQPRKSSFSKTSPLGIMYMLLSSILMALMLFLTKIAFISSNLSPFEIVYFRGLTLVVSNMTYASIYGIDLLKVPHHLETTLWIRTIFGTVAICLNFVSSYALPVSIANALFYIYPLITATFGYLLLKEKITKIEIAGIFVSFFGVILIVVSSKTGNNDLSDIPLYNYLLPIFAAFCACGVFLLTRVMGTEVHYLINPTWFGFAQATLVVPVCLITRSGPQIPLILHPHDMLIVFLACFSGWAGQVFLNKALQAEKAGRIAAAGYIQIPFLFFLDLFYFKLDISWLIIFGSFLIISCSFTVGLLRLLNIFD